MQPGSKRELQKANTFETVSGSDVTGAIDELVVRHEKELRGVVDDLDAEDAVARPAVLDGREAVDGVPVEDDVQVGEERERADGEHEHEELDEAPERLGELARVHDRDAVEERVEEPVAHLHDRLLLLLLGRERRRVGRGGGGLGLGARHLGGSCTHCRAGSWVSTFEPSPSARVWFGVARVASNNHTYVFVEANERNSSLFSLCVFSYQLQIIVFIFIFHIFCLEEM